MSIRKLVLIILIATPLIAQEPRVWQANDIYAEIGKLHVQVQQLNEQNQLLQARVRQLEEENAKLKEKPNATP